ncbi:MAG: CRISPR-associated endonuclease Cas1 [Deltaproteobacteria bacterium]|nr:CRISPR-associated endonuclease Cas1 [Kofleriaceae bacterium]
MLNEHTYCPRLAYLEWVQGDFADSADTVDGRFQHRNTNAERGRLPAADELGDERIHARSVLLSAPKIGLIARIDLLEGEDRRVLPVDYKRGHAPDVPAGAWEPERVQLCAQALVLEENGYRVDQGVLYFTGSRTRIDVIFDAELRGRTLALLEELRENAGRAEPPPPLVDSPKCPRCSLVGLCLPDEVNLLREGGGDGDADGLRRLIPARDDALPLYVQTAGSRIGRRGEELVVETREGDKTSVKLIDTSQICVFGAVQISTQAIQELADRGIAVSYLSSGGWFYAITRGMDHKNVELRRRQFAAAGNPQTCLELARRLVTVKIKNQRTIVRRNAETAPALVLDRMRELVDRIGEVDSLESLLGVEGTAARLYFDAYGGLFKASGNDSPRLGFDFEGRNRRPPKDPINALLSLGYALLTKDLTITLLGVGFDPYLGFYHQPRYGRPALALDVMEEFRPIIVDSVVLSAVNTGAVQAADFINRGGAWALTPAGRGKFIRAYERRMDELVTHPTFGYRVSYRRILEVQVRLLARFLMGELPEYPAFATR